MARKYSDGVDIYFRPANVCSVAQLRVKVYLFSGEVRISARHIQDINLPNRAGLIAGLNNAIDYNPVLAKHVIDYRAPGIIPFYRGGDPPSPRVRGPP